jgi:hypothetical protein
MEPDRRTLNERLRDASVEETLRGGEWLLTATLRQRIVRLLVMQVGVSALLVGFFLLLARSDLGAAIFSIAVTEGIMLVMGLAAAFAPERSLRFMGRAMAPREGPWRAWGDIRPDDFPRVKDPKHK